MVDIVLQIINEELLPYGIYLKSKDFLLLQGVFFCCLVCFVLVYIFLPSANNPLKYHGNKHICLIKLPSQEKNWKNFYTIE